ncbi:MAG: hypothetical protein WCV55_00110 [Candidatus Paceibacterota bacterium]
MKKIILLIAIFIFLTFVGELTCVSMVLHALGVSSQMCTILELPITSIISITVCCIGLWRFVYVYKEESGRVHRLTHNSKKPIRYLCLDIIICQTPSSSTSIAINVSSEIQEDEGILVPPIDKEAIFLRTSKVNYFYYLLSIFFAD